MSLVFRECFSMSTNYVNINHDGSEAISQKFFGLRSSIISGLINYFNCSTPTSSLRAAPAVEFPSDFRIFPISTGVGGKGMQKESIVYAAERKKFISNVKLRDSSHPSISINISSSKNNKRPQNVFNNSISFHSPFSFAKNGPKSFLISFKLFPFINQSSRSLWK